MELTRGGIRFTPGAARVDKIVNKCNHHLETESITSAEAGSLAGKLQFCCSTVFNGLGRHYVKALHNAQHAAESPVLLDATELGEDVSRSLRFFRDHLAKIPGRFVSFSRRNEQFQYTVFSDAFQEGDLCGLGGLLIDRQTHSFVEGLTELGSVSQYPLQRRVQQINALESLAAVRVLASFAEKLRGSKTLFIVDSTSCFYQFLGVKTPSADLFWSIALEYDIDIYLEYCASEANGADVPSRSGVAKWGGRLHQCNPLRGSNPGFSI